MMGSHDFIHAYLTWQGEIGCDEVILPHPLIRKSKGHNADVSTAMLLPPEKPDNESEAAEGDSPAAGFQHAPAFRPTSPANLFGDLSKALEAAAKAENEDEPRFIKTTRMTEAAGFPAFLGLADYWEYLEKNYRPLFASDPDARIIRGAGPEQAPLALASLEPGENDAAEGRPLTGEAGALLEKMMRAIRLETANLYCTTLVKHRAKDKAWSRRELVRMLPLFHIELGLARPPLVLLLGEACAQAVLKTGKSLEELRQTPHRENGREFVVTYHPDDLLQRDELKRKAWEDLQWLQKRMTQAAQG